MEHQEDRPTRNSDVLYIELKNTQGSSKGIEFGKPPFEPFELRVDEPSAGSAFPGDGLSKIPPNNASFDPSLSNVQRNSLDGPVSWRAENQVGNGDTSTGLGVEGRNSSKSHSTTVRDNGDSKQLKAATNQHERLASSPKVSTGDSLNTSVSHAGAALSVQHPSQFDVTDRLGDLKPTAATALGDDLRAAMVDSSEGGSVSHRFLPVSKLDEIIDLDRVRRVLDSLSREAIPRDRLDYIAKEIKEPTKVKEPAPVASKSLTSRRQIFAILALIDKLEAITDFIDAKLYDRHLPLVLVPGSKLGSRILSSEENGTRKIHDFFNRWSQNSQESFDRCQWYIRVPYFELSTKGLPHVNHYELEQNVVLPIMKSGDPIRGGFAEVREVKLHCAQHNYCKRGDTDDKNPSFALKKQSYADPEQFNNEVATLKRLSKTDNIHLVRLLVTFHYRDDYYLLFHWADGGNLQDLWENEHPDPTLLPKDELALWMPKQMLGIANGLATIHNCEIKPTNIGSITSSDAKRKYGIHGDLKPKNILWFKSYHMDDDICSLGRLQISDFGMSGFHHLESHSKVDPRGMSETYKAPEYDVNRRVSQKYDVWTLGCVLLEFVTWYLQGWKGVSCFQRERSKEDPKDIEAVTMDVFFTFQRAQQTGQPYDSAKMKKCVWQHFNKLRSLDNTTDYILELLDSIQDDMLRMKPEQRKDMTKIFKKLEDLNEKCNNKSYCTERQNKPVIRTPTGLSEIEGTVRFPPLVEKSDRTRRRSRDVESVYNYNYPKATDSQDPEPSRPERSDTLSQYSPSSRAESPPKGISMMPTLPEGGSFINEKDAEVARSTEQIKTLKPDPAATESKVYMTSSTSPLANKNGEGRSEQQLKSTTEIVDSMPGASTSNIVGNARSQNDLANLSASETPVVDTASRDSTQNGEGSPSQSWRRKAASATCRFLRVLLCRNTSIVQTEGDTDTSWDKS